MGSCRLNPIPTTPHHKLASSPSLGVFRSFAICLCGFGVPKRSRFQPRPRIDARISKRSDVSAAPWKDRVVGTTSRTSIGFQSAFVQAVNLLYQGAHLTPVATCCDYIAIAKPQVARCSRKLPEKIPPNLGRSSMQKVACGMTSATVQGTPTRPPDCFRRCYLLRCTATLNNFKPS